MIRLVLFSILASALVAVRADSLKVVEIKLANDVHYLNPKEVPKEVLDKIPPIVWANKCLFIPENNQNPSLWKKVKVGAKNAVAMLKKPFTGNVSVVDQFNAIANKANKIVDAFESQTKTKPYTDIQFEKAKLDFLSLASKLKRMDEKFKENDEEDEEDEGAELQTVEIYCQRMLNNLYVFADNLKSSRWNKLKVLGKPGVWIGSLGQKITSKLQKNGNNSK